MPPPDSDHARLVESPIDVDALSRRVSRPEAGAVLTFAGVVRNHNLGRDVRGIDYHAYAPMAEREIRAIERETEARWPGVLAAIVHRIGPLRVGEASVAIAVSSAHRDDGFAALRHAIDTLKERVPIWKKELHSDGESWIEGS